MTSPLTQAELDELVADEKKARDSADDPTPAIFGSPEEHAFAVKLYQSAPALLAEVVAARAKIATLEAVAEAATDAVLNLRRAATHLEVANEMLLEERVVEEDDEDYAEERENVANFRAYADTLERALGKHATPSLCDVCEGYRHGKKDPTRNGGWCPACCNSDGTPKETGR